MKLKVLEDNNTFMDNYYLGEPAVSYYIEDSNTKILFDVGYSDAFIKNAHKMNIDLKEINKIVISHGHNDHTGGLKYLFNNINNKNIKLIAHTECLYEKICDTEYIGTSITEEDLAKVCNLKLTNLPLKVSENIVFLGEIPQSNNCAKAVWQCIKRAKHGKEECPYCKAIAEEILEDCFVQGYRILCNDNRKVVENFLEKIENILKENTTETMVNKLEKDKEKINKKLANLLELNLEGKINKEQYTEKFDNLNVELLKIENKIQGLLKETNRNESIKQRLNKFKSLFKNIDIMPKFDKDVFECLIDKVVIGENDEDGIINPYTIRFICKNGTEINCKDKFTATSDKQHSNNTVTKEKQYIL